MNEGATGAARQLLRLEGLGALLLTAHIYGHRDAEPTLVSLSLIWGGHIGLDRLVGYGLKLQGGFAYTHLGMLGKRKGEPSAA